MGEELSTGVEDVITVGPDAVNVVVGSGEFTAEEPARLMFHKLLEPIFVELFIFHVVIFVFLCYNKNHFRTKERTSINCLIVKKQLNFQRLSRTPFKFSLS